MAAPILIFGGSGGIGAALAARLTRQGHPVHLAARNEPNLARTAADLEAGYTVCDVMDEASTAEAIQAAARDGGLGGLAYAVGSIDLKPFRRATFDDFMGAFALNVAAGARAIRMAHAPLVNAGGAILLFSTVAVQQGFASHAIIAAAKGGVEGLTRSLAAEFAPKVRVNALALSLTRTPLAAPMLASDALQRSIAALHPLGRIGEPEDAAALGAFLLGPEAGWITGQVYAVDGGRGRLRGKD